MHDCALGREGRPSAPRVEHRYYADDGIYRLQAKNLREVQYKKSHRNKAKLALNFNPKTKEQMLCR